MPQRSLSRRQKAAIVVRLLRAEGVAIDVKMLLLLGAGMLAG